jgi:hypothetical protein
LNREVHSGPLRPQEGEGTQSKASIDEDEKIEIRL